MSSNRSKLKLDEQSFETLLAAAFTVQEHNAKQKNTPAAQVACSQCGTLLEPEHQFCGRCGTRREEFRPGERMQRKWASMWLLSQQQSGGPDFTSAPPDTVSTSSELNAETIDSSVGISEPVWVEDTPIPQGEQVEANEGYDVDLHDSLLLSPRDFSAELAPTDLTEGVGQEDPRAWNLRLVLRFHRADLYLALAILVSAFALSWVIWGGPMSRSVPARAQLSLWDRTLVTVGIAEAPSAAPVPYRGDPNAKVWADPHTALYYCSGAEQFGKTPGGHLSTQREAQLDRFSPAARAACE